MPPSEPYPDLLDAAVALFNAQRWFEAHEAFEDLWRAAAGPRGELWKGLAQICAGFVKHERGQPASAATLLERGLGRVSAVAGDAGVALDLAPLVAALRAAAGSLRSGEPPAIPRILRRPV
jgi:hypothetical protein